MNNLSMLFESFYTEILHILQCILRCRELAQVNKTDTSKARFKMYICIKIRIQ